MNPALETLALAHQEHFTAGGNTLFLGAEPHPLIGHVTAWQPLRPLAQQCIRSDMNLCEQPTGTFRTILFLPGKSKDETLSGFARAHDLLAPNGTLIVSLSNTSGASRFEKILSQATPLLFSISKNKCRAFGVSNAHPWLPELLETWRRLAEPQLIPGTDFTTEPGIFSTAHIDPGSALLATLIPHSLRGHVADLGAGWGYLSRIALEKSPKISRIDLFEADARALRCAGKNVPHPATFHWHDVTCGLPQPYDHIITNPPFHTGQSKDTDLGKAFLTAAAAALKRGGTLHLVANRQLPYEAHLTSLGLHPRLLAETAIYKVIVAR